jgi:dihydroorotate dehydrogenase
LVPWKVAFPNAKSPIEHLGSGGVSGRAAQPFNWALVKRMVAAGNIPVIGPGVWEYEDIGRIRQLGARAASFGSIFLRYPWRPTAYVRRDMAERLARAA